MAVPGGFLGAVLGGSRVALGWLSGRRFGCLRQKGHFSKPTVPQEPVLRTGYLLRTPEACFLHRMLQKTLRVPQEAVLRTECQFRTVGGRFWYRMPPRQKGEEHCCTEFPKLPEKRRPKILSNEPHRGQQSRLLILLCLSLDETISSNLSKTQKISKS